MRNEYVLNVWTSNDKDMDYNLKRDGWLNSLTNVKNQSMREDGVPWRGAREKCPKFFPIFFSVLTGKDDIIIDWQCDVGWFFITLFFMSLFFNVLFYFIFVSFSIHFLILIFSHFVVLRGFVIACHFIQRHIMALKSDIDIFKSVLLPMRETEQEYTSQHAASQ